MSNRVRAALQAAFDEPTWSAATAVGVIGLALPPQMDDEPCLYRVQLNSWLMTGEGGGNVADSLPGDRRKGVEALVARIRSMGIAGLEAPPLVWVWLSSKLRTSRHPMFVTALVRWLDVEVKVQGRIPALAPLVKPVGPKRGRPGEGTGLDVRPFYELLVRFPKGTDLSQWRYRPILLAAAAKSAPTGSFVSSGCVSEVRRLLRMAVGTHPHLGIIALNDWADTQDGRPACIEFQATAGRAAVIEALRSMSDDLASYSDSVIKQSVSLVLRSRRGPPRRSERAA